MSEEVQIGACTEIGLSKPDWADLKRRRRLGRAHRRKAADRYIPRLRSFCETFGIEMTEVNGGWQFKFMEYSVSWFPATNRVLVQYRLSGHNHTVPYTGEGKQGKPRIQVALENIIALHGKPERHTHGLGLCG